MKLSLKWLSQYIDHGLSSEELANRMTMAGLEVEAVLPAGDDTVFEIEVTPNRPDCLNVLGLAREVSAITDRDLKALPPKAHADVAQVDITIEDKEGCGRYLGTRVEGVNVGILPADKSRLLQAIGLKPISNIVDITNFVLFEFGQPLHAFDADKLEGGRIIVRRAKKGEKIVTLDDIERTLDEGILVIADARKPVAIAGIMGGRDTAVTAGTRNILLESAYFDMGLVRRASRKLGLTSDSCYRFERGVDPATVPTAADRATDLILELAGGRVTARRDVCLREVTAARGVIEVAARDIRQLLGTDIDPLRARRILERLACAVTVTGDTFSVQPPRNRNDLKIREDIIEELARVVGFDNLAMSLPSVGAINITVDREKEDFNGRLATSFVAQGFHEILTHAMISRAAMEKTGYDGIAPMALQNPMSAEQELMRPTMLPSALQAVAFNMNRGQKDLKFFEIGKRYLPAGERWTLLMVMTGRHEGDWRRGKRDAFDLFDVKGALETAFAAVRVKGLEYRAGAAAAFEAGQAAGVFLKGQPIGSMGRISDDVLGKFEIKKAGVYVAEIDLAPALDALTPQAKFAVPEEFPAMVRYVSLAVKAARFEDIRALCAARGAGLLRKIELVEEYRGDKIDKGSRGLVLSLTYQAGDRTLTEDAVNALHESIVKELMEKFEALRR